MNLRFLSGIPALRVAVAASLLGGAAATVALARALHLDESRVAAAAAVAVPRDGLHRADPELALRPAFTDDPFAPDRQPAATPYQIVRQPATTASSASKKAKTPKLPKILGTVVATNGGSFAIYEMGRGRSRSVRVGDTIDGYVVDSIQRRRVVLIDQSGQHVAVPATRN